MTIRAPESPVYEVRCDACGVSFPPETRRCLHCGGRTHAVGQSPLSLRSLSASERGEPGFEATVDEAEEETPRSTLRVVSALIWLLLALAGGLYRACTS